MIRLIYTAIIASCFSHSTQAQKVDKYTLPDTLSEISGLEFLSDSLLVAINDGGDKARLYILNLQGELIRTVKVKDASNNDWEDLARDEKHLYIGDIGNNQNKRQNLAIYRVKIKDILNKNKVEADKIKIEYTEQKKFPPKKENLLFDAEAITVWNDTIYLFTKNRGRPSSGMSSIYQIPCKKGTYKLKKHDEIYIGKGGFWKDAVTAVDVIDDQFFVMTYNRIMIFGGNAFKPIETIHFKRLTQKESILLVSPTEFYVADEYQPFLGGRKLYHVMMNK